MKASQLVFGWFEASLNRSGVLSLCVFRPEVIHESGRVTGGQQNEAVAYSTWLKFFCPLSSSGIRVSVREGFELFTPVFQGA